MYAHKLDHHTNGSENGSVNGRDGASAPSESAVARLIEALGECSVAYVVRAADPALRADALERACRAALEAVMVEPCDIAIVPVDGAGVAAVLTPRSGQPLDPMHVHSLMELFRRQLCALLELPAEPPEAGPAILPIARVTSVESLRENLSELNELLETIIGRQLRVQFQPIIHFAEGRVYGYEALIRVPQTGALKRPGMYFDTADRARLVSWLDIACQEQCFAAAAEAGLKERLFINMDAEGLTHLHMADRSLADCASENGIRPNRVVLEITERQAFTDIPRLIGYIEELRAQGFQVAIDDAGAGYSGLRAIAELRPEFIKIDRSLVRTVHNSGSRRSLLTTLVRYAEQLGAAVVAEGMETRDELAAVLDLGIQYGQGYLLGKPHDNFKGLRRDMVDLIAQERANRERRLVGRSYPVGDIARAGTVLPPETPCHEAARKFTRAPDLESILVLHEEQFEGLLMRERFLPVFESSDEPAREQPIARHMDRQPLVVEPALPIEEAAAQATFRRDHRFHDDLVVATGGRYVGHLPVRALLEAVLALKSRRADYAHPVTGLPTGLVIEQTCDARLASGTPTVVLRLVVEQFRAFNGCFGPALGDDLLHEFARALDRRIAEEGGPGAFAGHMRGNDFLALIAPERATAIFAACAADFTALADPFYTPEQRRDGHIVWRDAAGQEQCAPLMRLRCFGVDALAQNVRDYADARRLLAAAVSKLADKTEKEFLLVRRS